MNPKIITSHFTNSYADALGSNNNTKFGVQLIQDNSLIHICLIMCGRLDTDSMINLTITGITEEQIDTIINILQKAKHDLTNLLKKENN